MVREEHGHASSARRYPRPQTMLDIYSRTVNSQTPLAEVLAEAFPWCEEHRESLAEVFRAYGERKRSMGVLDLDDLLLHWRALACDETVGPLLARAFDHVLVDEYQDVNGLQVDIVAGMCARESGLTVVGDDFQAIYGFRAASARHILEFPQRFAGTHKLTLEQNYRSTEPILAVANAVSAQDRDGYPKHLHTGHEGGAAPQLDFPRDESEQAQRVCENVLRAREEGMELRCQAVLFRTGHDSDLLELELARRGIPFVKYGGLRYLEAAHVKDLIALLRLAENPADEVSWFRVLQLLDGVGPTKARLMLDALREQPDGTPVVARAEQALAQVPERSRANASSLLAALAADAEHGATQTRVERLHDALAPLIRVHYADGPIRLGDLEQLVAAARGAPDLRHFVSELVLDPPASSADLARPPHRDEDYLVLSTVHSAKGLEWEAVHVISVYDGNFPADLSATNEESIAEERRLLYVALTRARRRLHVYVPLRYYHRPRGGDDAHGYGETSRFLTHDVQRLFDVTRPAGQWERDGLASRVHRGALAEHRVEVSVDALFA